MDPNPVGMALYEHRDRCSSNAARDKAVISDDHGLEEFEIALDTYCVRASPLMPALRDLAPDVDLFYHNAVPTALRASTTTSVPMPGVLVHPSMDVCVHLIP